MTTLVGLVELGVFLYFARKVLCDRDYMLESVMYCFVCGIINYKLFGSLAWLNIGISLYPSDFLVLLMLIVLLMGHYKIPKRGYAIAMLLFIVLAFQSGLRGLLSNGLSSEFFADLRKYLYFSISAMYMFCVPIRKTREFYERILDRTFNFLTIYAIVIMAFYFLGMPLGERGATRPLLAVYAIIYAAYTAYKWYKDLFLSDSGKISASTIIYTIVLILNRFNTTWVALGVAIAIMFIFRFWDSKREQLSWKFWVQLLAIVGATTFFVIVFSESAIMREMSIFFDKFDATKENTFSGRMEVWEACLATVKGLPAVIGFPFGSGFYVRYRNAIWQTIPHSGYIETLMRTGYIGITVLALAICCIIIKALAKRKILPIMLCAVCLVFWYSYELTLEQGLLIGACAQYVYFIPDSEKGEDYK